jgi:SAM-dependent methyltransferase
MGFYADQILPRATDVIMARKEFGPIRARVAAGLDGEVLEVGFGSGLNIAYYPPTVQRVRAVDPAALGRTLAAKRLAAAPAPVEFAGLDGQHLPVDSASVDHVLATWTLCSIPQPERALAEIYRVLRPGGRFHFAEPGRSPTRRWPAGKTGSPRSSGDSPEAAISTGPSRPCSKPPASNWPRSPPTISKARKHSATCTKASPPNPDLAPHRSRPDTPERTSA